MMKKPGEKDGAFLKMLHSGKGEAADILRRYVDTWLQSGRADGRDEPRKRRLPMVLMQELSRAIMAGNAVAAILDAQGQMDIAAVDTLGNRQGKRKKHIRPGEGYAIWATVSAPTNMLPGAPPQSPILPSDAQRQAANMFVDFMRASAKWSLSRCDKCKVYFYRTRVRDDYKTGAYCPKHLPQASMIVGRKESRKNLQDLAEKFWPQWTEQKHPNCARWIAQQMNTRLRGTGESVTQKWVTRNIDIRTGKVKEHAKG